VLETESDVAAKRNGGEHYKKEFIKSIKLCEHPLTVIKSIDDFIVVADALGKIRFYDKELKVVFWCPSYDFIDSVVAISFDMTGKLNFDQEQTPVRDFLIRELSLNDGNFVYSQNFTP
jgi:hypothetical protein